MATIQYIFPRQSARVYTKRLGISKTENGQMTEIKKVDFVVLPKGLSCAWDIKKFIYKHYNLKVIDKIMF